MAPHVVIIGAGLVGLFAAWHAARHGARVTILERGAKGGHASRQSAGGVRRVGRDANELPLALHAHRTWCDANLGFGRAAGFRPIGHLILAEDDSGAETLEKHARALACHDPAIARPLTPSEVRAYSPGPARVTAALFAQDDGAAEPSAAVDAATKLAEEVGVAIVYGATVSAIEARGAAVIVRTGHERISCDHVVNAAGAGAAYIARLIGEDLPIRVEAPIGLRTVPVAERLGPVVQLVGRKLTLKQMADGTLLIGGGHRGTVDLDRFEARAIDEECDENHRTAADVFPPAGRAAVVTRWAALDGYTPDGLPIIARSQKEPRLLHAVGFSGHGFQIAPAAGEVAAATLLSGEHSLGAPLALDRPSLAPTATLAAVGAG